MAPACSVSRCGQPPNKSLEQPRKQPRAAQRRPLAYLLVCRNATRSSVKRSSLGIRAYGKWLIAGGRKQELIANSEWLIARTGKVLLLLHLLSVISYTPYALFFGRSYWQVFPSKEVQLVSPDFTFQLFSRGACPFSLISTTKSASELGSATVFTVKTVADPIAPL